MSDPSKDVLISYDASDTIDKSWARWIARQIDDAQYNSILDWPEENAEKADCLVAVISPQYLNNLHAQRGFTAFSKKNWRNLVPIVVQKCELPAKLWSFDPIELFGRDEHEARFLLLNEISRRRPEPESPVPFPGGKMRPLPIPPTFPENLSPIWTIERHPNPFFTSREKILEELRTYFTNDRINSIAIYGLCGIGKTEIAKEYSYRYREEYRAVIWIDASSVDSFRSGLPVLTRYLQLPIEDDRGPETPMQSIRNWLSIHVSWLLVIDHMHDLNIAMKILPQQVKGHVLLISRSKITVSFVHSIPVNPLSEEDGALLLLRRIRKIGREASLDQASAIDVENAKRLSRALGGLPLALDQAGAYIEDKDCTITGYLERYEKHPVELLSTRGGQHPDHPASFAGSIMQDFQRIEEIEPVGFAAAELLRFCSFLGPTGIAEAIILNGADELGPILRPFARDPFELDQPVTLLSTFSLLHRQSNTLIIHPLIQIILQKAMDRDVHRWWVERTIRAMRKCLPERPTLSECQAHLPHLDICRQHIMEWEMTFREANDLLFFRTWVAWNEWLGQFEVHNS